MVAWRRRLGCCHRLSTVVWIVLVVGVIQRSRALQDAGIQSPGLADSGARLTSVSPTKSAGEPWFTRTPQNATVLVQEEVVLRCGAEAAGCDREARGDDRLEIRWWHYYDEMKKKSDDHKILKSGNLRIYNVMPSHQGYYRCKATCRNHTIQSKLAYLRVHAPATIVQGPTDQRVNEGEMVTLDCLIGGDPEPNITWTVDGTPMSPTSFVKLVDKYLLKVFNKQQYRFNATRTQTFECRAENHNVRGYSRDSKNATVHVMEIPRGYCTHYEGRLCQNYLGDRLVWNNLTTADNQTSATDLELQLLAKWKQLTSAVSAPCRQPIQALFCEAAYPTCINSTQPATRQSVCQEHCKAIESYFCRSEFEAVRQKFFTATFYLPDCGSLPSIPSQLPGDMEKSPGNIGCSRLHIFEMTENATYKCYQGDGRFYRGPVNITEKKFPCQSWGVQKPHSHPFLDPVSFSVLQGAGNRCRNPGGLRERPWCYILSSYGGVNWQYCDVPVCVSNYSVGVPDSQTGLAEKMEHFFTRETTIIVVCVSLVSVALFIIAATVCHALCRQRKKYRYNRADQCDIDIDVEKLQSNDCYNRQAEVQNVACHWPVLDSLEYPRNDIEFVRDIGRGAYGRVFKARAPKLLAPVSGGRHHGDGGAVVVVKMLREDAEAELQQDFEEEACLLLELQHPNVIHLLGVCAIGKPMCLLFEFMSHGDLTQLLRSCYRQQRTGHSEDSLPPEGEGLPALSHCDMVYMAEQLCSAMIYLSGLGYVHRDLATRNCLVGQGLVVKISDFSLTRRLDPDDGLFIGSDEDAVPIRWMPLEAIMYNKFSVKSDVWALGVVLWEIFAYAEQPYDGMTHEEILRYIHEGQILVCPDNTPQEIYNLMEYCWELEPEDRPEFQAIHSLLHSIHQHLRQLGDDDNAYQRYDDRSTDSDNSSGSGSQRRHTGEAPASERSRGGLAESQGNREEGKSQGVRRQGAGSEGRHRETAARVERHQTDAGSDGQHGSDSGSEQDSAESGLQLLDPTKMDAQLTERLRDLSEHDVANPEQTVINPEQTVINPEQTVINPEQTVVDPEPSESSEEHEELDNDPDTDLNDPDTDLSSQDLSLH